ncbi:MAG TPA: response regulator [Candidatus Paceibacterota bacterium]
MLEANNKIKVALIEDEEVLLNVLKDKLEKEGFEVYPAADGEIGISVIKDKAPDIILLDIVMPKVDGFGVLKYLQNDEALSKIPVIIISNSGQPVEIDKALELGVSDYLVKAEFDPQEVIDKIHKQLKLIGKEADLSDEKTGAQPAQIAAKDFSAFHILLVEDDNFLRDLISQKLRKENFNVLDALDGEDALKKTKSEKPHLILLDLILPGIDGFETLKQIRADEETGKTPVIVLSNLGQKDDVEKAKRLGATDYLIKAYNTPGEIVGRIKQVLANNYS